MGIRFSLRIRKDSREPPSPSACARGASSDPPMMSQTSEHSRQAAIFLRAESDGDFRFRSIWEICPMVYPVASATCFKVIPFFFRASRIRFPYMVQISPFHMPVMGCFRRRPPAGPGSRIKIPGPLAGGSGETCECGDPAGQFLHIGAGDLHLSAA